MTKDTDKDQPVSIEDEIASIIDSGETEEVIDDEDKESTRQADDDSAPELGDNLDRGDAEEEGGEEEGIDTLEADDSTDEPSEDVESDTDNDAGIEGDGEDVSEASENKLEAPEHWAATDRETFNEQTPKAQEWLLKRHKDMEGNMTRKAQEFASEKRQYDAIQDSLNPHRQEFAAAGLDDAGAVRQLASWHTALKSGGKEALLQLASTYNIDLSDNEDQYDDPALTGIKKELSDLKNLTARNEATAQQEKQNQIHQVIEAFQSETDETGAPKHPHFEVLSDDITRLFNAGIATNLEDGYNKALMFRPDLTVRKEPVKITDRKADQAEKVRKAKKAATGIKSSGASKQKRADMTLEEEIAANL